LAFHLSANQRRSLYVQLHPLPHTILEIDRIFYLLFPAGYQVEDDIILISCDVIGCHSLHCIFWWIVCVAIYVASDTASMGAVTMDAATADAAAKDGVTMDVVTMTPTVIDVAIMEVPKMFDVVAARVSGGCVLVGGGLPFEMLDLMLARGEHLLHFGLPPIA
jgi:hypothetical protein